MVKRIEWTERAESDLFEILDYWKEKTGSKSYSIRLYREIKETVSLLSGYPRLGKKEPRADCRYIIKENYAVYYNISERNSCITILHVRDMRRNPDELKIRN